MPWCDGCDRFWTTDAVPDDRTCPSCGRELAEPRLGDEEAAPWHFKLLLAAVVVYLTWRAVQLVTGAL